MRELAGVYDKGLKNCAANGAGSDHCLCFRPPDARTQSPVAQKDRNDGRAIVSGRTDEFEKSEGLSLGDVVISVDQAARQASENGVEFQEEISQLILSWVLHLCGYDHEADNGEMNRLERQLRRKLEYDYQWKLK